MEEEVIQAQEVDPTEKLYKALHTNQYYTKSLDEFKKQYSNPTSLDKLYSFVSENELYTKSKEDFYKQFFPTQTAYNPPKMNMPTEAEPVLQDLPESTAEIVETIPVVLNAPRKSTEKGLDVPNSSTSKPEQKYTDQEWLAAQEDVLKVPTWFDTQLLIENRNNAPKDTLLIQYAKPDNPLFSKRSLYYNDKTNEDISVGEWTRNKDNEQVFKLGEFNKERNDLLEIGTYFNRMYPEYTLVDTDGETIYKKGEYKGKLAGTPPDYLPDALINLNQNIPEVTLQKDYENVVWESTKNTIENIGTRLEQFLPSTRIFTGTTLQKILGKELAGRVSSWEGINLQERINEDYAKLEQLDNEILPTYDVVEGIKDGSFNAISGGVIEALGNVVSSSPVWLSGGINVAGEMIADYNVAKANRLGISVEELYNSNQVDYLAPATLGFISAQLEKIGLKGIGNSILGKLGGKAGERFMSLISTANREGITELLQTPLEDVNRLIATNPDATIDQVVQTYVDNLVSEKAFKAYVIGAIAGGAASGLGRLLRAPIDLAVNNKIKLNLEEIENLNNDLKLAPQGSSLETTLNEKIDALIDEVQTANTNFEKQVENLSEEDQKLVNTRLEEIKANDQILSKEEVSDQTKAAVEERQKVLREEVNNTLKEQPLTEDLEVEIPTETPTTDKLKEIQDRREQIKQSIKKKLGNVNTGINPEVLSDLIKLGVTYVQEGIVKLKDFSAKIKEDYGSKLSTEQIRSIFIESAEQAGYAVKNLSDKINDLKKLGGTLEDFLNQNEDNAQVLRDLTEQAAIRLIDGKIKSEKALGSSLQIENKAVLSKVFADATEIANRFKGVQVKPKGTVKQNIKKTTEGGIQGTVTLTNKQALKSQLKTLNQGVREGKTQVKDANRSLSGMLKTLLTPNARNKVSTPTYQRLVTQLSNAATPSALEDFSDTFSKVVDDAKYLDKLDEIKKLQKRIKTIGKKNVPADFKVRLAEMVRINPRYITKIDDLLQVLREASRLLTSPTNTLQKATEFAADSELYKKLKESEKESSGMALQNKIARAKSKLAAAGVDTSTIEGIYAHDQEGMLQALTQAMEGASSARIQKYRDASEVLLQMVKDEDFDFENLTDKEKEYVNTEVKNIDIKTIPDSKTATLVAALTNLINYNSLNNFGDVVAESKVYQASLEEGKIQQVQKAINIPSRFVSTITDWFASGTIKRDVRVTNQLAIPQIASLTGTSGLDLNTTKYQNYMKSVKVRLERINKKYEKQLQDPIENIRLGIYTTVSQYRESWEQKEIDAEYELRLKAWQESLDRLKYQADRDVQFERTNRNLIKNLTEVLDTLITKDGEGGIKAKLTKEDFYKSLGEGQKAFYEFAREEFEKAKEDFFFNARVNNNIDIEGDWVNYIPLTYNFIGTNETELQAITEQAGNINSNFNTTLKGQLETSKSGRTRTISGDKLPNKSVLSANFVDNFIPSLSKMVYDSNTSSDRLYVSKSLNTDTSPIAKKFKDVGFLKVWGDLATQKVTETVYRMEGRDSLNNSEFKKVFKNIYAGFGKLGVAQALGGLFAAPKQGIEIINVATRAGEGMPLAIKALITNSDNALGLIEQSTVANRDAVKSDIPTSRIKSPTFNNQALLASLKRAGIKVGKTVDWLTDVSLTPLTKTDLLVAKVGWLSFYIQYQLKNGKKQSEVSLDKTKLDREAADYANHMTSVTLNESDSTQKSKFSKNLFVQTHFMFSSFAINSKMDLIANISRAINTTDRASRIQALRNVSANIMNAILFNKISQALKISALYGGTSLLSAVVMANVDDDKKEKELLKIIEDERDTRKLKADIQTNKNLISDLVYGGIGGDAMGTIFNPATDFFINNNYTPEELKQAEYGKKFPQSTENLAFALLGTAGLPFKRGVEFYKHASEALESNKDFVIKRKGVINSELSDVIVDDYRLDEKYLSEEGGVPTYSRMIDGFSALSSGASLFGFTFQEAGNLRRLTSGIDRKLQEYDRGKVKFADVEKALKDAQVTLSIKQINGQEIALDPKQQQEYKKIRAEWLATIKKDYPYESYKNDITKEEYENQIRKVVDRITRNVMLERMNLNTAEDMEVEAIEKQSYREKSIKYNVNGKK